ncbi:hypothetical protein [Gordonia sp. SL306]|uniref:baeRF2 domain-containing protein n=1 Tax=Gordonia sp. SL306 TaxID=2995145 RepID=UPI003B6321EF
MDARRTLRDRRERRGRRREARPAARRTGGAVLGSAVSGAARRARCRGPASSGRDGRPHTSADIAVVDGDATMATEAVQAVGHPVHKAAGAETPKCGGRQQRSDKQNRRNIREVAERLSATSTGRSPRWCSSSAGRVEVGHGIGGFGTSGRAR